MREKNANKGIVTAGSAIDQCILCHATNFSPKIPSTAIPANPDGVLLENSGLNFAAAESVDSDSDGFNNLDEITAKPFQIRSRPISSSQQNQINKGEEKDDDEKL